MRFRAAALAVLFLGVVAAPSAGRSALPPTGWIPDQAGIPPFLVDPSAVPPSPLWITRRVVADPNIPGRFLLGTAEFGLFESFGGAGWTSLTPYCLPELRGPVGVPTTGLHSVDQLVSDAAGTADDVAHTDELDGCGIEGIAFDPQDPLGIYVSTYKMNLDLSHPPAIYNTQDFGGVYRGELNISSTNPPFDRSASDEGITWHRLLGGIRGNALAVERLSSSQPATIAAGRIQAGGSVGTEQPTIQPPPACGGTCSLYLSQDGGSSWAGYSLPTTCSNTVLTSGQIVGNLAFDPGAADVLYVGAESGFYYGIRSGSTWTFNLVSSLPTCVGNAGFAITQTSSRTLYVGNGDGSLYSASVNGAGPSGWTELLNPITINIGKILSVVIDQGDNSGHTLLVAAWKQGTQGVYRIHVNSAGTGIDAMSDLWHSVDYPVTTIPSIGPAWSKNVDPTLCNLGLVFQAGSGSTYCTWRNSLFLAQSSLDPSQMILSTVLGGAWMRSGTSDTGAL